ncbi:MAG: phage portal protein [Lachnospiraceae bacterium]|nr:phage portal protein [Lachnospiraceae bacterium]MCM1233013.1 phage portal protein [Ruminococcus flavefaciens]
MLRNLAWLEPGQAFPPLKERRRIRRYVENEALFDGEHFGEVLRTREQVYAHEGSIAVYQKCAERICQVIGNFDDVISFPVLLNFQRLMSLKMADLVCGEFPTITGVTSKENEALKDVRDVTDFDAKLFATTIDISRYGDAIWRVYLNDQKRKVFTCWDPKEWYPVVSQDGTNTVNAHVLCWRVNLTESAEGLPPQWQLHAQIHWATGDNVGKYEYRVYDLGSEGCTIGKLIKSETVSTGLDTCAVFHLKAYSVTNTVYGYDDYMPVDSILAEIMTRVGQISVILDKHADPNITGPVTMLSIDPKTGEAHLKHGKFFAVSQGEQEPKYMTWDGQLTAAFEQLEFLVNQLYILSEMGAALLGGQDGSSVAISGTAMRFKMVNPLAKARRIANSMTRPVRMLFSELSSDAEVDDESTASASGGSVQAGVLPGDAGASDEHPGVVEEAPLKLPIPFKHISVFWSDGLPDDPRENVEICKLATGATKMMPLETGIMEYFGRTNEEALQWLEKIRQETEASMLLQQSMMPQEDDPNHGGPQDGTGVNPNKKGSKTGLKQFHSQTNGGADQE